MLSSAPYQVDDIVCLAVAEVFDLEVIVAVMPVKMSLVILMGQS